ncbi:NAD(P)H-hydrate dehydratase [Lysobacter sp. TY2-98]|uniref:NAD(P)H-hydrate dehydratase n=1 Tax=Lysobacter sp. TY2-98 TaxID=2290922 RepID=UPI001F077B1F|nr:NAD(P)H-hydrate dehydratase [Lysobacter sp. TY2-98]
MSAPRVTPISPAWLRRHPLPMPSHEGDKDARGRILVIAGAGEMPGAALLSAVAALRAGAGKLQVATCASAAPLVAAAVPESRVVALPETRSGALATAARTRIEAMSEHADAIVVGPGLLESDAMARMLGGWLAALPAVPVVIDAAALCAFDRDADAIADGKALRIMTPHAGEAARLLGCEREAVEARPLELGIEMARRFRAVCVMKGATSFVIDGPALEAGQSAAIVSNRYGNVGLATSGSGDTLSGIIGGLAARGADPLRATAWGVYLHAAAGDALAERQGGPLGFLARELLDEIPRLMQLPASARRAR